MFHLSFLTNLFSRSFDPASYQAPEGIPSPEGTHTLEIYKFDSCPFCQRVIRHASKLGATDHITYRDTRKDSKAQAELLALTQSTQVPCLVIDGTPMLESKDINLWLSAYAHHNAIS